MNAEEIIKAIKEWHKSDERRSAVVILIDEAEKDGFLKSDCAILGKNSRITTGLKVLMNENEPFMNMTNTALVGSLIEKNTSK